MCGDYDPDGQMRATDGTEPAPDDPPLLDTLPDGYAAELVVMEWLGTLVRSAGPAGALRAVTYYERLGWISAEVRADLLEQLGGPGLDAGIDPTRTAEPTAEDHAESYTYVRTLARL